MSSAITIELEYTQSAAPTRASLPKASLRETLGVVAGVFLPNVAKGAIIRRPRMVALAERLDMDRRAVRRMQRLRDKYGTGPLTLRLPIRHQAVILNPDHVRQVLDRAPEPFATASSEKRAALSHFEPRNALISHLPERADRRRFNEEVLESDNPMHRLAEKFVAVVEEEAGQLLQQVRRRGGELTWDDFSESWFRVVRRVVFGDGARDDEELREMIDRLRSDGNWGPLMPKRQGLRRRFFARLNSHLARAEPGSLASVVARTRTTAETAPDHQVPQWLFAFDPAGMTTFRALALLASHPEQAGRAREEIRANQGSARQFLPFLRATVLESLRLWPTTPMVLRQTTRETSWPTGVMPPKTGILIFAPFFHRDDAQLPYANRFAPELWLEEGKHDQAVPPREWPLIPFSDGPGICPGRNLVLLVTSAMLAALLEGRQIRLKSPGWLDARRPLPGTLNHFGLRFEVSG